MRKIYLLFSVLLLLSNVLKAQNRTVTGTVTDEKDMPLPGVTVQIKGSPTSTATDVNGRYTIKVTNLQNVVIGVKFVGYNYQEKTLVVGQKTTDFKMVPSNNGLDEVVVTAYGTQKKATLTGAVVSVDMKQIQDIPALNMAQTLSNGIYQGGVGISVPSQRPGQPATITIRNPVTLSKNGVGTATLYVIDDIVRTASDFELLDPNEIESISILKDGEGAIYGINGANGAILVRTKRGKIGAPKISFSTSFGTANTTNPPKELSGAQLSTWINDYNQMAESYNTGTGAPTGNSINANGYINNSPTTRSALWYTPDELAYFANPANNTDFFKEYFHSADVEREALSISGGTDKVLYYIGGDYNNQGSNFSGINSYKYGLRTNVEAKPAKGLTVSLGMDYTQQYTKSFWYKTSGTTENLNEDVESLEVAQPWAKYEIDGQNVEQNTAGQTANLDNVNIGLYENSDNYTESISYITNIIGRVAYEIPGVKGLIATVTYNYNENTAVGQQYGTTFNYTLFSGLGSNDHIPGGTPGKIYTITNGNDITFNPTFSTADQLDAGLNYTHSFGKSNLTILGLYETRTTFINGVKTEADTPDPGGLPNFNFTSGTTSANQANGLINETGLLSYIGRVNYDYDGKYLFQGVFRRDGDGDFSGPNQYGNFGSLSLGWVASNEKFIKDNFTFINMLKLRANIGFTGTDNTPAYLYAQQYNVATGSSGGAVFNEGDRGYGYTQGTLPNPGNTLTWDHTTKLDYGVDAEFLKSRLAVTADYFWNHGYDLLTTLSGAVPFTIGNTAPSENYGIVNTFGYELAVGWRDHITNDWSYDLHGSFSWSDDKNIKEDISPGLIGTIEDNTGRSDDQGVLGYQSLGIIRTQAQANQIIASRAAEAGGAQNVKILGMTPAPGMINYADLNHDGVISASPSLNDVKYLSHKSSNHNSFGLNIGTSYKAFSFNVGTGISWGGTGQIPSYEYTGIGNGVHDYTENKPIFWADHWTPQTPDAKYPAPAFSTNYNVTSNFWFINSTSWNIGTATMGYTLPSRWTKVVGVSSARLYAVCQNVASLLNPYPDHYRSPNATWENYPNLRTFSVGLNVGF